MNKEKLGSEEVSGLLVGAALVGSASTPEVTEGDDVGMPLARDKRSTPKVVTVLTANK